MASIDPLDQLAVHHFTGIKMTDINAETTLIAFIKTGGDNQLAFVTYLVGIGKIAATVVAAKTNSTGCIARFISKWTCHQLLVLCFQQDCERVFEGRRAQSRTAACIGRIKAQANIHTRSFACAMTFTATAIRDKELLLRSDQFAGLFVGTDIVDWYGWIGHIMLGLRVVAEK
jgi:hypothetical protein